MWGRSARARPAPSLCPRTPGLEGRGKSASRVRIRNRSFSAPPGPTSPIVPVDHRDMDAAQSLVLPEKTRLTPPSFFGGGARACATHDDLQSAAISCRWRDRHEMEASSCSSACLDNSAGKKMALTYEGYCPLERADLVLVAEQVEARAGPIHVPGSPPLFGQDGLAGWLARWLPSGRPPGKMAKTNISDHQHQAFGRLGWKGLFLAAEVEDQKGTLKLGK